MFTTLVAVAACAVISAADARVPGAAAVLPRAGMIELVYVPTTPGQFGEVRTGYDAATGAWYRAGLTGYTAVTPGGRLLRRSSGTEGRPALFAAQFALSHVCWLIAYPLAGQVGARAGMGMALAASAVLALAGTLIAWRIWPREDPEIVAHSHDDLPSDHPHLREGHAEGETRHAFVIDELHPNWPGR